MIVTLPHSLATARHWPVGLAGVQVFLSALEVKITGLLALPLQTRRASRVTASEPPASLATTVPAWMVRVAPGET